MEIIEDEKRKLKDENSGGHVGTRTVVCKALRVAYRHRKKKPEPSDK